MYTKAARINWLLVGATLILSGCGVYSFNPGGESQYKTIAIEPFENKTAEYGLADRLTEIVVDAFIADGSMKVVSETGAEAILVGALTDYQRVVQQYDESNQVEEYKVVIHVDISLQRASDRSEIWKERIPLEGVYNAATQTEEDGQRVAGELLVETVINRTTKSW